MTSQLSAVHTPPFHNTNNSNSKTTPLYQRIFIPTHVYRHPSAILLELCTSMKELHQILPLIIKNGFYNEDLFQTKLVSLFCKYGSISEAARVFEPVEHKLDVLYHTMLKGYAKNSTLCDALSFYHRMQFDEVKPVVYDFTYLLQLCGENLDFKRGREIHGQLIANGFESNLFAMTAVVNLYAKCRQIDDAYKMFERMPQKNLVSWTMVVAGYAHNGFARRALHLILEMQEAGQKPDFVTLVSVLPAVADIKALRIGRSIHGYAIRSGFESLVNVSTTLLDMYFKCGSVETARLVFERMSSKNVVSWNSMIDGLAQNGESEEAFATFLKMLDEGVKPTNVSMMGALHACSNLRDLERGRFVHRLLDQLKLGSDVSVMNSLISMYSKCKRVDIAASIFDHLKGKTNVTWSAMIFGYAQNGYVNEALDLFCTMQEAGQKPDFVTLVSVLPAVADIKALRIGRSIHGYAIRSGFESLVNVSTTLLDMYFKCGSVETARLVFERMSSKNVVSWNSMIDGLAQNGESEEAFATFLKMLDEGVKPTNVSMMGALHACSNLRDLERGRFVHRLLDQLKLGSDVSVMNSLISMYSKCKRVDIAASIFDHLKGKTNVTWNAMIFGYAQNGCVNEALDLFCTMQEAGQKPDFVTLVSVLPAVADIKALRIGRSIHGYAIRSGFESLVNVSTTLLDMYFKCGSVETARLVFERMSSKNVVSWNSMIDGLAQNGESEEAFATFLKMLDEGVKPTNVSMMGALHACSNLGDLERGRFVHRLLDQLKLGSDVSVMNSLISMYSKCKRVDIAASIFDHLKGKTNVTWNAMIFGYAQNGCVNEALDLFCTMQSRDIKPDSFTFVSVITALADLSVTCQAKWIHGLAIRTVMDKNVFVATALVDMYAKCGAIETARKLFNMMQERHVIAWNAMIDGYGTFGLGRAALDLFNDMQMEDVKPNDITFLFVISACSHSGFVEEGRNYFKSMKEDYGLEPAMDHYGAMVDLLGRAGKLDDAWNFINEMPIKPGITVLGAMLGACKIHKNVELGEKAADKLFELDPDEGGYHVLLANMYASASMWDKVARVRTAMEKKGLQKTPGCSFVELRNEVHTFYSGSPNHPQSKRIYAFLETLGDEIRAAGYVPDTNSIQDMEDDVKEQLLCSHSERLAIAFGLLNTSPGTTIHIRKNLRVCGDCHDATKYISLVTGREIIVRDLRRFHHFKNGSCSCGDYW